VRLAREASTEDQISTTFSSQNGSHEDTKLTKGGEEGDPLKTPFSVPLRLRGESPHFHPLCCSPEHGDFSE